MTTEDDFINLLCKNPKDKLTWLVFADWLQERSDPRELACRAIVDQGWAPYHYRGDGQYQCQNWEPEDYRDPYSDYLGTCWMIGYHQNQTKLMRSLPRSYWHRCLLPTKWFSLTKEFNRHIIDDEDKGYYACWRKYDSLEVLFADVLAAHVRMQSKQRKKK